MEKQRGLERAGYVHLLHARTQGLYRLPGLEEIKEEVAVIASSFEEHYGYKRATAE
jgi:hypothetical protein